MVGPGLTHRDAHHAIHEAAFTEAEELTRLLRLTAQRGDQERALHLAGALIEHWQTRTLRHADVEEAGWYRDVAREHPERQTDIAQLTRDHDLLRRLLEEIEQILAARGLAAGVVERFEAMLLINAIHSREEEQRLLGAEEHTGLVSDIQPTPTAGPSAADVSVAPVIPVIPVIPAMPVGASGEVGVRGAPGDDADAQASKDAPGASVAAMAPLAVTHPGLYRQGMAHLATQGIHPGDLRLSAWGPRGGVEGNQDTQLRAAFGRDFAEVCDVPFPDPGDPAAVAEAFAAIAAACARTIRADYYEAMQMTEPSAPGRQGQRAHFNLTIVDHARRTPSERG